MRRFQEYLSSSGKTDKKAVVDAGGDQVDMPKPKAKEDPHKKNKTKGEQPQVKEAATTDEYENVKTKKPNYKWKSGHQPQVQSASEYPPTQSKSYSTSDGVEQVKEYLTSKGKLVKSPSEEAVSDYHGPNPHAPQKPATSGKGWKSDTSTSSPSPYRASGGTTSKNREIGFADMGKTHYEPDTSQGNSEYVPGGKSSSSWPKPKVTTEEFLKATKDMSLKEFTKYMLDECSCNNNVVQMKWLAEAVTECDKTMDMLVHEIKAKGGLPALIEALMSHRETFVELNSALADKKEGESRCYALVKAMNEAVGPPMGKAIGDMDDDEEDDLDIDMDDDEEDDLDIDMDDEDDMEGEDIPKLPSRKKSALNNMKGAMSKYGM